MADEIVKQEDLGSADEALEIVESITKQNPRLFNGIAKNKKEEIVRAFSIGFMHIQKSHSGPLPDPDTLEQYSKIIDNGAERIMVMAEKEQSFRHSYNEKIATTHLNQIGRGQWFGFILSLLGIGGGIYLAFLGKDTAGVAVIITSIVALVGAFVFGKPKDDKK